MFGVIIHIDKASASRGIHVENLSNNEDRNKSKSSSITKVPRLPEIKHLFWFLFTEHDT